MRTRLRTYRPSSPHAYDYNPRPAYLDAMSRKVLILSGSPRKGGNSETLCHRFEEGARDAGNSVEFLRVCDLAIGYCTGCDGCVRTGKCCIRDDMSMVSERMMDADVLVLSSPVYFYTISAQIKTLIDRTVPFYQKLSGKEVYFVVTAADPNEDSLELAVESFRGFTRDCLPDCIEKGVIKATGVWGRGEVDSTEFMDIAYRMGRSV